MSLEEYSAVLSKLIKKQIVLFIYRTVLLIEQVGNWLLL